MFAYRKVECLSSISRFSTTLNTLSSSRFFSSSRSSFHQDHQQTVDCADIANHSKLAKDWWNPMGPMKLLHSLNSLRVPLIRDGLINTNETVRNNRHTTAPLKGIDILEVGCGAGVLTEQLARLKAKMIAIDPGSDVIMAANEHLKENPIPDSQVEYKNETIEQHSDKVKNKYDAVIISEVIEHVNEPNTFVKCCVDTLKPGGSMFITTFNKTILSWLGGIVMAEYILQVVPRNTHDWDKFIPPVELQNILDNNNCTTVLLNGFTYNVLTQSWNWTSCKDVSYALQAVKH